MALLRSNDGILTVDTDAQAWTRAKPQQEPNKGGGAAERHGDGADQAPVGEGQAMRAPKEAKPGGGPQSQPARRGAAGGGAGALPDGYRRRRDQRDPAQIESHWIGSEVKAIKYLPAEPAFFRDIVSGVVRDQRKLDPLIDEALVKGLAAQADRGRVACRVARRRL